MESFFTIAEHFTRSGPGDLAHSALPNAPVLPADDRGNLRMRWSEVLHRQSRRPRLEIRRAEYRPGCSAP